MLKLRLIKYYASLLTLSGIVFVQSAQQKFECGIVQTAKQLLHRRKGEQKMGLWNRGHLVAWRNTA